MNQQPEAAVLQGDRNPNCSTTSVVTTTPEPSSATSSSAAIESITTSSSYCPIRASGHVCICGLCEAARTRLIHRKRVRDVVVPASETGAEDSKKAAKHAEDLDEVAGVPTVGDDFTTSSAVVDVSNAAADKSTEPMDKDQQLKIMSAACKTILTCIGEDPNREGLLKTPERWSKALQYFCHGYALTPEVVTNGAVFRENHDEMVVVRNIDIHSLCEHHMAPFTGVVHIGYIPNGSIIGLSKLARIAELYARRLQVQERLTRQIADAVVATVQPLGVAVVVECKHYCMIMRGVRSTRAVTTTSSVRGCFETNSKTRAEFFSILHGGSGSAGSGGCC